MKFLSNNVFLSVLVGLSNFIITFLVFMYNYNHLATPYLHEEQRVDNAIYIFSSTIIMFAIIAVITAFATFFISRNKKDS